MLGLNRFNGLSGLSAGDYEGSLAEKYNECAAKNIEERSEAICNMILDLCEKASKDGAFELPIKPCDDTMALFKHPVIRNNVFKQLKSEGLKIRIEKKYILIKW